MGDELNRSKKSGRFGKIKVSFCTGLIEYRQGKKNFTVTIDGKFERILLYQLIVFLVTVLIGSVKINVSENDSTCRGYKDSPALLQDGSTSVILRDLECLKFRI